MTSVQLGSRVPGRGRRTHPSQDVSRVQSSRVDVYVWDDDQEERKVPTANLQLLVLSALGIGLVGDESAVERRAFGDTLGIYYRYFRWTVSGATLWTLSVSLVYPLAMFTVLPLVWAWRRASVVCRIWFTRSLNFICHS